MRRTTKVPDTLPAKKAGRPKGSKNKDPEIITLNENEQLFADLICENLLRSKTEKLSNWRCYQKAYPGIKDASAKVLASLLLKTPKVQSYIQRRKRRAAERAEVKIKDVLRGLLRIATFDHRKLLTDSGKPISNFKNVDDATAMAISEIDFDYVLVPLSKDKKNNKRKIQYVIKKIKTESRLRAWELIGQYLKMFDGQGASSTPQEYVKQIRDFANAISSGVPGGKL